jgi:hypothetical protein
MAQHVRVDRERHLGGPTKALDESAEAYRPHRRPTLAHEYVAARLLLALEPAERPQFSATERVHARQAALNTGHMEPAVPKVYLIPA